VIGLATLGSYNSTEIQCRPADEFVNATAMCQATGKRWAKYWENQQTQEFIAALARQLSCPNSDLIQSSAVRGDLGGGTWVHRRVAIHLAQWCSPDFAVWVTGQIEAIMTGQRVAHREHAEHAIADIQNDISVLHSKYESLVTRMLSIQEQNQHILNELLPMVKRIDERTQGIREGFSASVAKRFVSCVERYYHGQCPCCQLQGIVLGGKRIPHIAQLEHYHHRSMNRLEHGWIVCKTCNNKLKNRKPNGYWFQAGPAFQQFQRLLHAGDSQLFLEFEGGE
jgi:hypothetical protein